MAQTVEDVRERITSLLVGPPFRFTPALDPDSFDAQPVTNIDGVFRIAARPGRVLGGIAFSSVNIDLIDVWVARRHRGDPLTIRTVFLEDVHSITAAVTRDGAGAGDYGVEDGRTFDLQQPKGADYAVCRITLPVNYEASV